MELDGILAGALKFHIAVLNVVFTFNYTTELLLHAHQIYGLRVEV